MKLCVLSWVVIILSIIGTAADIYLIESTPTGILLNIIANVIVTFLLVLLTNWSCYSPTFYWIAWIVVIFTVISTVTMLYIITNRDSPEIKKELEEEKKLRNEFSASHRPSNYQSGRPRHRTRRRETDEDSH
jgi:hypothetical protein